MGQTPTPQPDEAIFSEALALPATERSAYLEQACGGDAALRLRVEALLRAHDEAGNLLDAAPGGAVRAALSRPPPEEKPGALIGRYKLLQKIGEGGCGVVFMAEQQEPVVRRVALKVIKLGMDTREVIARFEAERQALAMMDHPNIAKVFDAGATDTGRPYFVMELVHGVKITDYCDQQNLSTGERLNLFIQVCHAIQHAHQKGIIHRDIKPSNILVTLQDGKPMPKVIDFGIAKATQGRLTDHTLFTAFEQFIGTPTYMSPEQAQLTSQDIDTRSDVYSLGVLLYELLTGQTPFDAKALIKAGLDEIRRVIREDEPPNPSTRLRTLEADALTTTAQHRSTVPPKLLHLVRGDLDWIVMRCLEKNRVRRYATSDELARDLERHLHNEPVTACPPSALYRFQKLVRRNKLAVVATTAIAAALVIGLAVSLAMYSREKVARVRAVAAEEQQSLLHRQAEAARERAVTAEEQQRQLREQAEDARNNETQQRALAEEARANEAHQRELAEADRKKAETEANKSQQVAQFLTDMLNGVGPGVALGRDTKLLREILDKTAERVGRDFKDQPAVEGQLRVTLGGIYDQLGEYEKAEPMLREALAIQRKLVGNEHPTVAVFLGSLAQILWLRGDLAGAEAMEREALALQRKTQGDETPITAILLCDLGKVLRARGDLAGAEAVQREALVMQRKLLGNEQPKLATTLIGLAQTLTQRGDYVGAEAMLREALAIQRKQAGKEQPSVATTLDSLASVLEAQGDLAGAEALDREAVAIQRKFLGNEHPELAVTLGNLAVILSERGDLAGAEALDREALAMRRKLLGNENPDVATSLHNLGADMLKRGDLAGAEATLREGLAMQRKLLGNEHPDVAASLLNLASILSQRGDLAGAEALEREALAMLRKTFGNEHPKVATAINNLAMGLLQRGNFEEAETLMREALAMQRHLLGNEHPDIATSLNNLALILGQRGDPTGSEAMQREALTMLRKLLGNEHPSVTMMLNNQAGTLLKRNDYAGAESLLNEALALQRKMLGNEHPSVANTLTGLASIRMQHGDLAGAETLQREALAMQHKLLGNENPDVAISLSSLAFILAQRGDVAGAEALTSEALVIQRKLFSKGNPGMVDSLTIQSSLLLRKGDLAGAEAAAREALMIQRTMLGNEHPSIASTLLVLGAILIKRDDLAGAEVQLLEAWRIEETAPPSLQSIIKRPIANLLVRLYEIWAGKDPTKSKAAQEWKQRSQAIDKATPSEESAKHPKGNQHTYANTKKSDSAILRSSDPLYPPFSGFIRRFDFTDHPPQVIIREVDGAAIKPVFGGIMPGMDPFKVYVSPGNHRMRIGVGGTIVISSAIESVEIHFEGGRQYNLTAKAVGNDFDLMFWDESQGARHKPTLLNTWRLKGRNIINYFPASGD